MRKISSRISIRKIVIWQIQITLVFQFLKLFSVWFKMHKPFLIGAFNRRLINQIIIDRCRLGGHSITTWTRWEGEGSKRSVFVHAQGIKTVHAGVHVFVECPLRINPNIQNTTFLLVTIHICICISTDMTLKRYFETRLPFNSMYYVGFATFSSEIGGRVEK